MNFTSVLSIPFLVIFLRIRPGTIYNPKDKGGIFGYNYGVLKAGNIKIGDPVYQLSS